MDTQPHLTSAPSVVLAIAYHTTEVRTLADPEPVYVTIASTAHHQETIIRFAEHYGNRTVKAIVKAEPTNPSDPPAKVVLLDGEKIGYIPSDLAATFLEGSYTLEFFDTGKQVRLLVA